MPRCWGKTNKYQEGDILDKQKVFKEITENLGIKESFLDEPMKRHTSFRVGGSADVFVVPKNIEELKKLLKYIKENNYFYYIIGNGSNLLVRDKGIRGIVINIASKFNDVRVKKNYIEADAGILISSISSIALKNSLTGLEFASGIPGSLGGAIVMNAGAYGGQVSNVVVETTFLDENCNVQVLSGEEHQFGYRTSYFTNKSCIVLKAKLKLAHGDKEEIRRKMTELMLSRNEKQPLSYPSAGSVFKRPEGHYAGKLIEDAGLKGTIHGGAQISDKHTGFIINKGGATANDIIYLINFAREKVKEQFDIELETEVKIIGEE